MMSGSLPMKMGTGPNRVPNYRALESQKSGYRDQCRISYRCRCRIGYLYRNRHMMQQQHTGGKGKCLARSSGNRNGPPTCALATVALHRYIAEDLQNLTDYYNG